LGILVGFYCYFNSARKQFVAQVASFLDHPFELWGTHRHETIPVMVLVVSNKKRVRMRMHRLLLAYGAFLLIAQHCFPNGVTSLSLQYTPTLATHRSRLSLTNCDVQEDPESLGESKVVVVVGAGVAGLAAAWTLLQQPQQSTRGIATHSEFRDEKEHPLKVLVLEAKDRVGGRLWSVPMSQGTTTTKLGENANTSTVRQQQTNEATIVDLGGMYWHGDSPVLQHLQSCFPTFETVASGGTSQHPGRSGAQWLMYDENGNLQPLPLNEQAQIQVLYDRWDEHMCAEYATHRRQDRLLRKFMELDTPKLLSGWSQIFLEKLSVREQSLLQFQLDMAFGLDGGIPLAGHALRGLDSDWDWIQYKGEDRVSKQGMQHVMKELSDDIVAKGGTVQTEQRVTRIQYASSSLEYKVTITTESGTQYYADACIVALPLGVLKASSSVLFDPALPSRKQSTLDRAAVGALNTVAVRWNRPVCARNTTAYYLVGDKYPQNPLRNGYVCSGNLRGDDPTVTQFYLSETCFDFDDMTYWKTQALEIVQDLMPGEPKLALDDILDIKVSQWHLDPDIRGSYSAPATNTRGDMDRKRLAESVDRALFFAGEHTNYEGRYQSIDGAYETGVRAAAEVADALVDRLHHSRERGVNTAGF
jgi:monoamine oxidase